jgi:hypothetical protein
MKNVPTDMAILDKIYNEYYDVFSAFSKEAPNRQSKIFVPVDIKKIAHELGVDEDIVFGRLYYDLEKRYGYREDDGTRVSFFSRAIGKDRDCINFPYAASVLAALRDEKKKFGIATGLAILSLVISIASICLSLFK